MLPIPFVGPSYTVQSLNASNQAAINCYVELTPEAAMTKRVAVALYGSPGLRRLLTVGPGPHRGAWSVEGSLVVVSGAEVWIVATDFSTKKVGTLNTSSGRVCIRDNRKQVLIVDGKNGYLLAVPSFAFSVITDANFQNGARWAEYQNTFFFTSGDGSAVMRSSGVLDGSTWASPDFANIESRSLDLLRAFATHNQLVVFTPKNIEIWVDAGLPAFPYQQSVGVLVEHGLAAPDTVVNIDNTLMWLGQDETGVGPVWKAQGYNPVPVSNAMIDREIQSYGDVSDAFAFAYQQNHHLFYVLTFPSADKTWVYDVSTDVWHERAWFNAASDSFHRWRPNTFAFWNNLNVCGDFEDGRLYALDLNYPLDDTDHIVRIRRSQTLAKNQAFLIYNRIQLDMQTGVATEGIQPTVAALLSVNNADDVLAVNAQDELLLVDAQDPARLGYANPQVMLRWSNDGGHTWSSWRYAPLGRIGRTGIRALVNRCGRGRNRIWELRVSDPVVFALFGAFATVTECLE